MTSARKPPYQSPVPGVDISRCIELVAGGLTIRIAGVARSMPLRHRRRRAVREHSNLEVIASNLLCCVEEVAPSGVGVPVVRAVRDVEGLWRADGVRDVDSTAADVVPVACEAETGVREEKVGEVGARGVGELVDVVGPPGACSTCLVNENARGKETYRIHRYLA